MQICDIHHVNPFVQSRIPFIDPCVRTTPKSITFCLHSAFTTGHCLIAALQKSEDIFVIKIFKFKGIPNEQARGDSGNMRKKPQGEPDSKGNSSSSG